jgi:hypothetical protein
MDPPQTQLMHQLQLAVQDIQGKINVLQDETRQLRKQTLTRVPRRATKPLRVTDDTDQEKVSTDNDKNHHKKRSTTTSKKRSGRDATSEIESEEEEEDHDDEEDADRDDDASRPSYGPSVHATEAMLQQQTVPSVEECIIEMPICCDCQQSPCRCEEDIEPRACLDTCAGCLPSGVCQKHPPDHPANIETTKALELVRTRGLDGLQINLEMGAPAGLSPPHGQDHFTCDPVRPLLTKTIRIEGVPSTANPTTTTTTTTTELRTQSLFSLFRTNASLLTPGPETGSFYIHLSIDHTRQLFLSSAERALASYHTGKTFDQVSQHVDPLQVWKERKAHAYFREIDLASYSRLPARWAIFLESKTAPPPEFELIKLYEHTDGAKQSKENTLADVQQWLKPRGVVITPSGHRAWDNNPIFTALVSQKTQPLGDEYKTPSLEVKRRIEITNELGSASEDTSSSKNNKDIIRIETLESQHAISRHQVAFLTKDARQISLNQCACVTNWNDVVGKTRIVYESMLSTCHVEAMLPWLGTSFKDLEKSLNEITEHHPDESFGYLPIVRDQPDGKRGIVHIERVIDLADGRSDKTDEYELYSASPLAHFVTSVVLPSLRNTHRNANKHMHDPKERAKADAAAADDVNRAKRELEEAQQHVDTSSEARTKVRKLMHFLFSRGYATVIDEGQRAKESSTNKPGMLPTAPLLTARDETSDDVRLSIYIDFSLVLAALEQTARHLRWWIYIANLSEGMRVRFQWSDASPLIDELDRIEACVKTNIRDAWVMNHLDVESQKAKTSDGNVYTLQTVPIHLILNDPSHPWYIYTIDAVRDLSQEDRAWFETTHIATEWVVQYMPLWQHVVNKVEHATQDTSDTPSSVQPLTKSIAAEKREEKKEEEEEIDVAVADESGCCAKDAALSHQRYQRLAEARKQRRDNKFFSR